MASYSSLTETIASTATIRLAQLPESSFFCTPIEERFERMTRLARRALNVPVAAITFLNEDKQWFKSVSGWAVTELPHSQSFCPITLAAGRLTVFEDTIQEPTLSAHPLVMTGPKFRFYAGYPIMDESEQLCGTFCVLDQKPRQFSATDKGLLADLAELTQTEIFNERMKSVHTSLMSKLGIARRESMMDPLTRLWNRRGAAVMIKTALDAANVKNSSIGIAVVDLDNFKHVNDKYGHQIGDEVLRKTALRLIQSVRTNDSLCRIGGDEFLLIMKDADSAIAKATTHRMREVVAEAPIPTRQGPITITTSVGFTVRSGNEAETVDDLMEKADRALMQSKAEGRNRVIEIT